LKLFGRIRIKRRWWWIGYMAEIIPDEEDAFKQEHKQSG